MLDLTLVMGLMAAKSSKVGLEEYRYLLQSPVSGEGITGTSSKGSLISDTEGEGLE